MHALGVQNGTFVLQVAIRNEARSASFACTGTTGLLKGTGEIYIVMAEPQKSLGYIWQKKRHKIQLFLTSAYELVNSHKLIRGGLVFGWETASLLWDVLLVIR